MRPWLLSFVAILLTATGSWLILRPVENQSTTHIIDESPPSKPVVKPAKPAAKPSKRLDIIRKQSLEPEEARQALSERDAATRWLAIKKLSEKRSAAVVEILLDALEDPERSVREEAARGLDRIVGLEVPAEVIVHGSKEPKQLTKLRAWWKKRAATPVAELRLQALKRRAGR